MTKQLAEYINQNASIYFKQIKGFGCAINSRVTDWSSGTTLLFYYNHKTYNATFDTNGKCTTVKEVVHV
jgi:hypothetical protein